MVEGDVNLGAGVGAVVVFLFKFVVDCMDLIIDKRIVC